MIWEIENSDFRDCCLLGVSGAIRAHQNSDQSDTFGGKNLIKGFLQRHVDVVHCHR